jgi:flagellar basal body rod protein FlgC
VTDFALLDVAARGMAAQRAMLDLDARNLAAAQAATPGHPYQRLVAHIVDAGDDGSAGADDEGSDLSDPIRVASETGTGDALTELIATLDAQRAFEANASLFETGKRLAERTLDIDR